MEAKGKEKKKPKRRRKKKNFVVKYKKNIQITTGKKKRY